MKTRILTAIVLVFALVLPVSAEPVPVIVNPGEAAIIQCETGWDNVNVTQNEVTAVCNPEPTATPTPEPTATATPTPEPTATPTPVAVVFPVADVSTGSWSTPPLWEKLADQNPVTEASSDNDAPDVFEVELGELSPAPQAATLEWTARKGADGGMAIFQTVTVLENGVAIASFGPQEVTSTSAQSFTLNVDATDWSALTVRVERTHTGTSNRNLRILDMSLTSGGVPEPSATPGATATSTPTPAPTATPSTGDNVSGIAIPAPFSGYERVHFTEFPNTQTLGNPPHPDTLQYLQPRPNVSQDCTYNDSSGRGKYCWKATTSEHNGVLDMWLHTETGSCKTSGFTHQHNGNGGCNYVAGPKWTLPNQDDFVISYVAKLDDVPGRKVAYLRWCGPGVGQPGYCEDNFVEAKLEAGPRGNAFHHHESRSSQDSQQLNIELDEWHLYQMHVKPGQFVDFYLDGALVLHATAFVSTNDSYWVFQSETYLSGQAIPVPHNEGHLLLDSYAVDLPAG